MPDKVNPTYNEFSQVIHNNGVTVYRGLQKDLYLWESADIFPPLCTHCTESTSREKVYVFCVEETLQTLLLSCLSLCLQSNLSPSKHRWQKSRVYLNCDVYKPWKDRDRKKKIPPKRCFLLCQSTVKSWFNDSRFNMMSLFKGWNLETKMKFHVKMSRFSVKSQFKEWMCVEGGHSLSRDFTVSLMMLMKQIRDQTANNLFAECSLGGNISSCSHHRCKILQCHLFPQKKGRSIKKWQKSAHKSKAEGRKDFLFSTCRVCFC